MIERHVRGDPANPRAKAPRRVEAGPAPIRAPERFNEGIFGATGVLEDPPDPAIDLDLELPEERFERVLVASYKPLEEITGKLVRHRLISRLTGPRAERFRWGPEHRVPTADAERHPVADVVPSRGSRRRPSPRMPKPRQRSRIGRRGLPHL